MAFCNKLSGILRQGVSQSSNVPVTSMLGSLRYMSTKLFIGGKCIYNLNFLLLVLYSLNVLLFSLLCGF